MFTSHGSRENRNRFRAVWLEWLTELGRFHLESNRLRLHLSEM